MAGQPARSTLFTYNVIGKYVPTHDVVHLVTHPHVALGATLASDSVRPVSCDPKLPRAVVKVLTAG